MSSVNLVLKSIEKRGEVKQFILFKAKDLLNNRDFDTDHNLTVEVTAEQGKHYKVTCRHPARSTSRAYKKIFRKHHEIKLGSAANASLLY